MMQMFPSPGLLSAAQQQAQPGSGMVPINANMTPPPPPAPKKNFFERVVERLQEPEFQQNLMRALATVPTTLRPNAAENQAVFQAGIDRRRLQQAQNKTIEYLKQQGRPDLARMVEADPSLARDVLMSLGGVSTSQYAPTVSGIQIDPNTGEQYVVITDRNTQQPRRMNVGNATQLTPSQEQELELQSELRLQDIAFAQDAGRKAMGQVESLDSQINKMVGAYKLIEEEGAKSGLITNMMPAFNASTAQLRSMANQLGIDVINSATFGALSATELELALKQNLDLTLDEPELIKQIDMQIRAKGKMREELFKMARTLTSGIGYSDFIKQFEFIPSAPPEGVPIDVWYNASASQKRRLLDAAMAETASESQAGQ